MTRPWVLLLFVVVNAQDDRKSSLTFVIDVTRSMASVKRQVEEHAAGLFEAVVRSNESYIEDFVLVTFADTDALKTSINNVTKTKDPNEFKKALDLTLVYGGSCPESSMSGIETGIENSAAGSTIYVFTDASANDYEMYEHVKDIALKKDIQIVFVLTGKCNLRRYGHEGFDVYDSLAVDTSGQVFNLHKNNVSEILKWLEYSVLARRIILKTKDFTPGEDPSLNYTTDLATRDTSISMSGCDSNVSITGPDGEKLETKDLVHLDNIVVLKVNETLPGTHTVAFDCKNNVRFVVSAKSNIQFRHGFSGFVPTSLNDTTVKPSEDENTYLAIKTSGNFLPQTVKFVDVNDNIIPEFLLPLKVLNITDKLFVTKPMDPPFEPFRIIVTGIDLDNNATISRVSTSIIETQNVYLGTEKPKSSKPKAIIKGSPKILIEVDAPLQLKCTVHGYPKPSITWEKDGDILETKVYDYDLPYVYVSVYNIKVKYNSTFVCKADNSEGVDKQSIFVAIKPKTIFDVVEKPENAPIIGNISDLYIFKEGVTEYLNCRIKIGTPKPTIQWYYNDGFGIYHEIIESKDNEDMKFSNVNRNQAGKYKCIATNDLGSDTMETNIIVEFAPTVDNDTKPVALEAGQEVVLTCSAGGVPEPDIKWMKNNESLMGSKFISTSDHRLLFEADLDDTGVYNCIASNKLGSDSKSIQLEVHKTPMVRIVEGNSIKAEYDEPQALTCEVLAYPKPHMTWLQHSGTTDIKHETEEKGPYQFVSYLKIDNAANATYQCDAHNTLGSAQMNVTVTTGSKPFFNVIEFPQDKIHEVRYQETAQFLCKVDALPPADINWYKNGEVFAKNDPSRSADGSILTIKDMQPIDQGIYKCEANNSKTSLTFPFKVQISGLEAPIIGDKFESLIFQEGGTINIQCRIHKGTPTPTINWYYNDVSGTYNEIIESKDNEDIKFSDINRHQAGKYKCIATNDLGSDIMETNIIVEFAPTVDNDTKPVSLEAGQEVVLTCSAGGVPEPDVKWMKNNESLMGSKFVSTSDHRLVFEADLDDTGVYNCIASNKLGSDSKSIKLEVHKTPMVRIVEGHFIKAEYGEPQALTCEVLAYPKPHITWLQHSGTTEIRHAIEEKGPYQFVSYLKIDNAANATYQCEAHNTLGSAQMNVTVTTGSKPFFNIIEFPQDNIHEVIYQETAQFLCKVDAFPPADINWYKNGEVFAKNDPSRSTDGSILTIKHMQSIDQGTYKCEVNNSKTSFTFPFKVQISGLEAPIIGDKFESLIFQEGGTINIQCRIHKGTPTPTINWYYNDVSGTYNEIVESKDNEDIKFSDINRHQAGKYKCIATNDLGSDIMETNIIVEFAPTVDNDTKPVSLEAGQEVVLTCSAGGVPEPDVKWMKNNESLMGSKFVSTSDHRLVFEADLDDTGVYNCIASNKLGSDSKSIKLEVHKTPMVRIVEGHFIKAEYGEPQALTCEVLAYPKPHITWLQHSGTTEIRHEIEEKGPNQFVSYLKIDNAANATYQCEAHNTLGSAQMNVTVTTGSKPFFNIIEFPQDNIHEVIYQETAQFLCKVDAFPPADINWYKNGEVFAKNDPSRSADGSILTIKDMQPIDQGIYKCEANNSKTSLTFPFKVQISGLEAPIIGDKFESLIFQEGGTINIQCRIHKGTPTPTINWYYNDVSGTYNEIIESKDNEDIKFSDINRHQAGKYKCIATNDLGSDIMETNIIVEFAPTVDNDTKPVALEAGQEVVLTCSAGGVPEPDIKWMKNNESLMGSKYISTSEHRLVFEADLDDTGVYNCIASNKLGSDSKSIKLEVHKTPMVRIVEGHSIKAEYGEPQALTCEVLAYPKPHITWLQHSGTTEIRHAIEEKGPYQFVSYLKIDNAANATYQCEAHNTLGSAQMNVTVTTGSKPFFNIIEFPQDNIHEVIYQETAQFLCKVDAFPPADINWYKNGEVFAKNDPSRSADGSILTIKHMQSIDQGTYKCEVNNSKTSFTFPFKVQISGLEAPIIGDKFESLIFQEGGTINIQCRIHKGTPTPTINWYYNDVSGTYNEIIESKDNEDIKFSDINRHQAGKYKCIATNDLGSDIMETNIIVEFAPTVDNDTKPVALEAGQEVVLTCSAGGVPEPDVKWMKNNESLIGSKLFSTSDHRLVFEADLDDTGVYNCIASNKLGSDSKSIKLEVHKTPMVRIVEGHSIKAEYGEPQALTCEVLAYPKPHITWLQHSGTTEIRHEIEEKGPNQFVSYLKIDNAANATYQCDAHNTLGSAQMNVTVTTGSKPFFNIIEFPQDNIHEVRYQETAQFLCKVDAFPPADINWYKNGEVFAKHDPSRSADGSILTIKHMQPIDQGIYKCEANNSKTSFTFPFKVQITGLESPKIFRTASEIVAQSRLILVQSIDIPLSCNIVQGIPKPSIKWLCKHKDWARYEEIKSAKDQEIYHVSHVNKDIVKYACEVSNWLGSDSLKMDLVFDPIKIKPLRNKKLIHEKDTLKLRCQTQKTKGLPRPTIKWVYKGTIDEPEDKPLTSKSKDTLLIRNIQYRHRGRYTCYATSIFGMQNSHTFYVDVYKQLEMHSNNEDIRVVEGDKALTIHCNATANPKPKFKWTIGGIRRRGYTSDTITLTNIRKGETPSAILCEATSGGDFDTVTFRVAVDDYPSLDNPNTTVRVELGENIVPLNCPIPHKSEDLLRWYKNNRNVQKGELNLYNARSSDAGLYTCRVSNTINSRSANVFLEVGAKLDFMNTDVRTDLTVGVEENVVLDCLSTNPVAGTTWFFNGVILSKVSLIKFKMDHTRIGNYTCEVTTGFETITRTFDVNLNECLLKIDPDDGRKPLILTQHFATPGYQYKDGYLYMPKNQTILLVCEKGHFNYFKYDFMFAYCNKTTQLEIEGEYYNYKDLQCNVPAKPYAKWTGKACKGEDSEMIKVGYQFHDKIIEVYETCMDMLNEIPFYVMQTMRLPLADTVPKMVHWFEDRLDKNFREMYAPDVQLKGIASILGRWFHKEDRCVFSERQLVGPLDVFPGAPQRSTFTHLNVVPHWSTCSTQNWVDVELNVRTLLKSTEELTVWTGASEELKLTDELGVKQNIYLSDRRSKSQRVSTYIWKVVQYGKGHASLAIIQINIPDITADEATLIGAGICTSICSLTNWMNSPQWVDSSRGYVVCCRLDQFEARFGFRGLGIFGKDMANVLLYK